MRLRLSEDLGSALFYGPNARVTPSSPRLRDVSPRIYTEGVRDPRWLGVLKKSAEIPPTIRHRKNRCGRKGSSSSFAAALGRPFCFFSPERRPVRPHGAPWDVPHVRNADESSPRSSAPAGPPARNTIASDFVRNVRLDRRRFPSPILGNDTITTQRFDDLS